MRFIDSVLITANVYLVASGVAENSIILLVLGSLGLFLNLASMKVVT